MIYRKIKHLPIRSNNHITGYLLRGLRDLCFYLIISILWLGSSQFKNRRRLASVDVDKPDDVGLVRRWNLLEDETLVEEGEILLEVELLGEVFGFEDFVSEAVLVATGDAIATRVRRPLGISRRVERRWAVERFGEAFARRRPERWKKETDLMDWKRTKKPM